MIGTINVAAQPRKVVMQANRNGFLYVLDAKDGKLLAANAFEKVNWADGVDLKTGRPKSTDVFNGALEGKNVTVWPSVSGGTNWQHMSFSPKTGLLYINTIHVGMTYEAPEPAQFMPGKPSGPGTRQAHDGAGRPERSRLPEGRRSDDRQSQVGGALQEPELLVDHVDGEQPRVHRRDDRRIPGPRRRHRQAAVELPDSSGIVGQPVTWEKDGKQYVTVMSGIGGVYAQRAGDPNLANVPAGASLWTFGLFDR